MTTIEQPIATPPSLPVGQFRLDDEIGSKPDCMEVGQLPSFTPNRQIVELVPHTARRVLIIGRWDDGLVEELRAGRDLELTAWHRGGNAASPSPAGIDRNLPEPWDQHAEPGAYDAILMRGCWEVSRRPADLLAQVRRLLAPQGCLVAQVANLRNHRTLTGLLKGRWSPPAPPSPAQSQLRFYTRREIEKTLYRSGFALHKLTPTLNAELTEHRQQGNPTSVSIDQLAIEGLSPTSAEELFADSFVLRAAPESGPEFGLTSIIMVTHNELSYTHQCLESVRFVTDEPFELIVVDNGSTDGTVDYLRRNTDVTLIANPDNRGFPAAVNQGLAVARGEHVLLLNNDTLVTTGWLRRLLEALHSAPDVGLVGPVSNCVGSQQMVPVTYQDLSSLDGFAWERAQRFDRQRQSVDRLVGFCLLLRRSLYDELGPLDEQFGIGNFEDDDYCRRALQSGYRLLIAQDSFVHHFGSRTFAATGVDYETLFRRNQGLFQTKWPAEVNPAADQRQSIPTSGLRVVSEPAGLRLKPLSIRLSLCMIVRDNEPTIRDCLRSIRPWVDEMIVVDTGSQDRTVQIVRELGAEVRWYPWCTDFSAARNESLRHARGEWIFWMDSDDTISPENGAQLRQLALTAADDGPLGYVMQVHCPGSQDETDITVVDHVKLFRNLPQLRFEGRIHEQIIPAIRQLGGEVAWTDLFVVHSGSDQSPAGRRRKQQRDLDILSRDLAERPRHPFVLFNLGMTYADMEEYRTAIGFLRQSIEVAEPTESHIRKAYALLVGAFTQLQQYDEAAHACAEALAIYPEDMELRFREGIVAHQQGRLADAEAAYLAVLNNQEPRHFSSVDRGIGGFKTHQNLAIVYSDMQREEQAERQWRQVIQQVPSYREGWRGLGECLLKQRKFSAVDELANQLQRREALRIDGLLLQAHLARAQHDAHRCHRFLEQARQEFPQDPEPIRALGQYCYEQGDLSAAALRLRELTEQCPDDPAAWHNLGTTLYQLGSRDQAIRALQRSLQLRPDFAPTRQQLQAALQQSGPTPNE